jgi:hypothetical protein
MLVQSPTSEFLLNLPLTSPRRLAGLTGLSGRANPLLISFLRDIVNQNNRDGLVTNNINTTNNMGMSSSISSMMTSSDESLGTTRDLLFGVFFGTFFGFMALLCVWDHNIPFRQKVGILLGVIIQLLMGTLVNSPPNNAAPATSTTTTDTTTESAVMDPINAISASSG